ncbi:hypothetical protein GOP47_0022349 [Adiantum capillus-veneris]|uniref:DUF7731 domain-containing protein n=1 Tax=Adiantum capillus-veneris TaxID=13818 RepID=A0A9D4Z5F4_ADICA|nr:hypothetical protein GOP47_0022349 [Adiantum capillus-veneris]
MACVSHRRSVLLSLLALILAGCCCGGVVRGEDPQGEVNLNKNTAYNNALKCLQNQSVECPFGTALNESGVLLVNATTQQQFCGGTCANQTLVELSCISNVLADFRFNNDATITNVKDAIQSGCATGNFTVNVSKNGANSWRVYQGSSWLFLIIIAVFTPIMYTST